MYSEVTNTFKEAVKNNIITTTAKLTFKNFFPKNTVQDVDEMSVKELNETFVNYLVANDITDLIITGTLISEDGLCLEDSAYSNGQLIGTAMAKELEIDVKNPYKFDLSNKEFELEIGVMTDRDELTYEYIPYGTFIIVDYEDLKSSNKYKIVSNDLMIKLNEEFNSNRNFSPTFPITAKNFYIEFMTSYGIEVEEQELANQNFLIEAMPNFDGYTGRQVLMRLAELFGSFAKINRNNKCQMYLKTETEERITSNEMNSSLEIDNRYGPVNVVTVGLSNVEGENVTLQDNESIETYGETTIRIDDNPFVYTEELREQVIQDLFNRLNGFSYIPVKFKLKGLLYTDCGDTIQVENVQTGEFIETIILNQYWKVPKTRQSEIESPALTNIAQKYKYISKTKQAQTRTEIMVDKQGNKISLLIDQVGNRTEKTTSITQDIDGIDARVGDIEDITDEATGITSIEMKNCAQGDLLELHIYGNNTVFNSLYPSKTLYPATDLYPQSQSSKIKITDSNNNETVYDLGVGTVLRQSGNYKDEFVIKDGKSYVIRRIIVDDNGTITINSSGIVENEKDFSVALTEGTNNLQLLDYTANMYVKWVVKNDYTDLFGTKVDMHAQISETATQIRAEVAEEVTTINGEISSMSAELDIQKDQIGMKLDSSDFNSSAVIGLINNRDGTSTAKIGANNINLDGFVKVSDLSNSGTTEIDGSRITTGTISSNILDTSTINAVDGTIGGLSITQNGLSGTGLLISNTGTATFPDLHTVYEDTPSGPEYADLVTTKSYSVDSGATVRHINIIGGGTGLNVAGYTTNFNLYASTSDPQLKKNIEPTEVNALDVINQIEHIQFNWKNNEKFQANGYNARNLGEICEDFVDAVKQEHGEYDEILQVRDFNMLPYVTKAIQELYKENQNLKERIERLEEKIND